MHSASVIRRDPLRAGRARRASAYRALLGLFLLNGLLASSWIARLPAVRDVLGLTPAEFGVLLPSAAVGAIATVAVVGRVMARFGGARTLAASSLAHAVGFGLLGIGPALGSTSMVVAGLVVNGSAFALGNVPLNVESAGQERRAGRAILHRFHAAFSLGTVVGSLVGVACAAGDVALRGQFAVTAAVAVGWRFGALPYVIHDTHLPVEAAPAGATAVGPAADPRRVEAPSAWREGRVLLLGLIVLSSAIGEGAANDGLSIAVVDGFGRSDAVAAAVFGVFVVSMTAVRLAGTRLIDCLGRTSALRASAVTAACGIVVFTTAPGLPAALVGVAAWGLGFGLVFTLAISAASEDPERAANRVAVASGFAAFASLAGPPVFGAAADVVGPRLALLGVLAVTGVILVLSRQVAPREGPAATASARPRLIRHPGSLAGRTGSRSRPPGRLARRSSGRPDFSAHREYLS